jgi:hypothetical protein
MSAFEIVDVVVLGGAPRVANQLVGEPARLGDLGVEYVRDQITISMVQGDVFR